jgi:LPXTG-motif cell wall-anchored protein
MGKTLRHACLLALIATACVAGLGAGPVATAASGSCTDPANDTVDGGGLPAGPGGALDVVTTRFEDSTSTIFYTFETREGFDTDQVDRIDWHIDLDADDVFEGEILISGDPLQGIVYNSQFEQVATAQVQHTDGFPTMGVNFPRSALDELGAVGSSYEYLVETLESNQTGTYRYDFAGPCTHSLGGQLARTDGDDSDDSGESGNGDGGDQDEDDITLDDATLQPGDTIAGSAEGFDPGSEADVFVFSTPQLLGSVAANSNGVVNFSFALPTDLEAGTHTLEIRGVDPDGDARVVRRTFTVAGSAVRLPDTGAPTLGLAAIGVNLVSLGGALWWSASRRRRRSDRPAC